MKILLFLDLDDTIFQTKRKNKQGVIPATETPNPENISYMTKSQKLFLDIFLKMDNVRIIPITARALKQYKRTYISKHPQVSCASVYFSGAIYTGTGFDPDWQQKIRELYSKMSFPIEQMYKRIYPKIDHERFNMVDVDGYYLAIKSKNRHVKEYRPRMMELLQTLPFFMEEEYFIHQNANNIAIIPRFLDKKHAVDYLINKFEPELTIGAGDSITDLNFMKICDFKIIPKSSQIEKEVISGIDPVQPLNKIHHNLLNEKGNPI